jgi:membrane protein DedA with SNARE-associated domain
VEHFLETWGYLAVFVLSFISAMGLPVGAEVAIIYGGVLASGQVPGEHHPLNVVLVVVVAGVAEVCGSLVGYSIGKAGGRPLVEKLGKYILLTSHDLDRAEAWFTRRGDSFVFFGRFIPLVRTFVSLAAGIAEMSVRKFILFTALGCTIWCAALAGLGDSLGSSYRHVLNDFSSAGYVFGAVAVVVIVVLFVHRLRTVRRERAASSTSDS